MLFRTLRDLATVGDLNPTHYDDLLALSLLCLLWPIPNAKQDSKEFKLVVKIDIHRRPQVG
jgi:hypothetical protein